MGASVHGRRRSSIGVRVIRTVLVATLAGSAGHPDLALRNLRFGVRDILMILNL